MAEKKIIKTVQELSVVNKEINLNKIKNALLAGDTKELEKQLKIIQALSEKEVDRRSINQEIAKSIEEQNKKLKEGAAGKDSQAHLQALKRIETVNKEITKQLQKQADSASRIDRLYKTLGKSLDYIVKQNQEIYKTSHEMQLQGNITWREFRELYNGAYESARRLNREIGTQLYTARELVSTQEKMISTGWKGLAPENLVNVTQSMALLQRTLGDLDARLVNALQISYNQFGARTDTFVTQLGNNLNAFSDSFGLTVASLQGAVAEMLEVNTFIARNNLTAQITANTSFMQAAALSSGLNMQNINFIGQLTRVSEFGTMSDLADLYTSGALLEGFNASDFITGLQSGDYLDQTRSLIKSIRDTLGGMEDNKLLRNEYMKRLQSGFGLSQGDLIAIMNAGDNLETLEAEINEKLLTASNSMVEELAGLKVTLIDQIENFWANWHVSQGFGKVMNELGLYGLMDPITKIKNILLLDKGISLGKTIMGVGGTAAGASQAAAYATAQAQGLAPTLTPVVPMGAGTRLGLGIGGLVLGGVSSHIGTGLQTDITRSQAEANLGAGINILGQAASGALMGAAFTGGNLGGIGVGFIAGLAKGIYDASQADRQRQTALEELDAQERRDIRAAKVIETGEPIIDTLNHGFASVVNAITGEGEKTRTLTTVVDLIDKGSTKGSIVSNNKR
jgi:hypothetical protein